MIRSKHRYIENTSKLVRVRRWSNWLAIICRKKKALPL